jgi:endogenous inhibitor of DNA gyrase (YacG/DUF329 family)
MKASRTADVRAKEDETTERCATCGDPATQWDYDQMMHFCDRHVQQADFTVLLSDVNGERHPNR